MELDDIRAKKLAMLQDMQKAREQQDKEQKEFQERTQELEAAVKMLFTKEALERYGNIRSVDPQKALQAISVIAQLAQAGSITSVDDELFKKILHKLAGPKREIRIKRK